MSASPTPINPLWTFLIAVSGYLSVVLPDNRKLSVMLESRYARLIAYLIEQRQKDLAEGSPAEGWRTRSTIGRQIADRFDTGWPLDAPTISRYASDAQKIITAAFRAQAPDVELPPLILRAHHQGMRIADVEIRLIRDA